MPGKCTYQFTSPDRSTFLTFLLNELRLSAVLSFLGSLDQMRGPKYFIERLPYQTVSNFGSSKSFTFFFLGYDNTSEKEENENYVRQITDLRCSKDLHSKQSKNYDKEEKQKQ